MITIAMLTYKKQKNNKKLCYNFFMKIGIVSLGLIGGSILKALSSFDYELFVVTRNPKTIESAKTYTQNVSNDISTLKDCKIVFVCSPMNRTNAILDDLESIVSSDTIVSDVCSLKEFLFDKNRPYQFIGTHPMAGTEHSGFDFSFKELFVDAKWVVTPSADVSEFNINLLLDVIKKTGAIPVFSTPKEHDEAVALISHMPLVLSQALMLSVKDSPLALNLAASGFRDMTRLAMSNVEMANDMVELNNENIKKSLQLFVQNIDSILHSDYLEIAEMIKEKRQILYNKDGKNIYN